MFPKLYGVEPLICIYSISLNGLKDMKLKMKVVVATLLALVIILSGCTEVEDAEIEETPSTEDANDTSKKTDNIGMGVADVEEISVSSSAVENNGTIPVKYTCDGENINPPLEFSGVPDSAKSLVLIVDDPDAPGGTFTHWVVWAIAPDTKIQENSVPGIEGMNDFRKSSYGGPCPPSGTHRYFFTVYALDAEIDVNSGSSRHDVEKAMEGHIIAKGYLMGKYSR